MLWNQYYSTFPSVNKLLGKPKFYFFLLGKQSLGLGSIVVASAATISFSY